VSEPLLTHEVIGLESCFEVILVNTDRDTHQQVLGSFGNGFVFTAEQVRFFQSLETEEVVIEISGVVDLCVNFISIGHNNRVCFVAEEGSFSALSVSEFVKFFSDFSDIVESGLVEGEDGNLIGKHGVVGVYNCHVCAGLSTQVDNLSCLDA
jgi:hypothetical protein